MRRIFPLLVLSLSAVACNKHTEQPEGEIVVKVGNKFLTKTELEAGLPKGLNQEDSILASEKNIKLWIKDNLLYDIASKNIADKEKINQLVENYRKSLIIYQYQEQLINEKLSKEISDEETTRYYEENKDKFKLDKVLIKGLYLKIPSDAPQLNNIKEWYKSSSKSALEKIEKYCLQNAVVYDYFYDRWVDFNELEDNLPIHYNDPAATVRSTKNIELKDSSYCYFLNIKEYLLEGDDAPYEYALPTIKELLINQKKVEFLKKAEDDLYNKALDKGQIKFYEN